MERGQEAGDRSRAVAAEQDMADWVVRTMKSYWGTGNGGHDSLQGAVNILRGPSDHDRGLED
ncbi:hypothetical protein Psi02_15650 [Planotetraspora silvatica]|uniref:Uncharacterized protein n=1 Tax=Planotetraspora silvatica TaxID=234614 RepID=A0A8J3XMF0_9ACTN|nr:hypothetical protein Psi02_15650 [Planotetraspora silvatica]